MAAGIGVSGAVAAAVQLDAVAFVVRQQVAVDRALAGAVIQADADAFRAIVERTAVVEIKTADVQAYRVSGNTRLERMQDGFLVGHQASAELACGGFLDKADKAGSL